MTRSADYIQLYRGDTETLAESLEIIQKTASGIVQAIHEVELAPAEMAPPMLPVAASAQIGCHHTLYHTDAHGNLQGSWTALDEGDAVRIECSRCGKFYGNQPKEDTPCIPS